MKLYAVISIVIGLIMLASFVFYMYLETESDNHHFEVTHTTRTGEPMEISSKYSTIHSEANIQKTEFQVGEEITVSTHLVNVGPETVPISHGKPPFVVSVYDVDGNLVWQNVEFVLALARLVTLDVGVFSTSYSFTLDSPGQYDIESMAWFITRESEQSWRLHSDPITITVLPNVQ